MAAAVGHTAERSVAHPRHRPETTALYENVRDNLETLYGALDGGALDVRAHQAIDGAAWNMFHSVS